MTERLGKIELVDGEQVSLLTDLTSLVGCPPAGCAGERGLMSLAVAPDFATTGHLYVDYIDNSTGEIHVDQLTATGDTAPLSTRLPVLTVAHSQADNHNGGQLQFGPDGYLYISTGDGGGGNDEFHNSQNLDSLLGKLLRIDPQPNAGGGTYLVPAGNPFPSATAPYNTIWSYGLRNPFRFSFDSLTGDLVIGDVGQGAREEVDYAPRLQGGGVGGAGANWGWNCREGFIAGPATDLPQGQCATGSFAEPVFDYPHTDPGGGGAHGCAILGGYVARDADLVGLEGRYVYADLCTGDIRSLQLPAAGTGTASDDRSTGLSVSNPFSFGEDSCGRLYVVSGGGEVSRFEGASGGECPGAEPEPEPEPEPETPPIKAPPILPPPIVHLGPAPAATQVTLKAGDRLIEPGARASLTAHVTLCAGRGGQPVQLNRGGRQLMSGYLDADCAVRFAPRVGHRSTFRLIVPAGAGYLEGRSSRVTISTLPGA